jgi:hypothetical protein
MAKQRFDETQTGGEGVTPQVGADSTTPDVGKTGAEDVKISKPADSQEEVTKTQQLDPIEFTGEKPTAETTVEPEPVKPNVTEDKQPAKASKKGEEDYSVDLEDENVEEQIQQEPEENEPISDWMPEKKKSFRNPVTGKWIYNEASDEGQQEADPISDWMPKNKFSEDELRVRANRIAQGGIYKSAVKDGVEPVEPVDPVEPVEPDTKIIKTLEEAQKLRAHSRLWCIP